MRGITRDIVKVLAPTTALQDKISLRGTSPGESAQELQAAIQVAYGHFRRLLIFGWEQPLNQMETIQVSFPES